MNKSILIALGICLSGHALAGSGWTGFRTILGVETNSSGTEIRLSGFSVGCTEVIEGGVSKTWTKININHANKEQMMAVFMMAYASDRQINVYCSSAAQWANADNIQLGP